MDAPLDRVFNALVDREALETWLPPGDMTGYFELFDPTPGGSYRLVLTYTDPAGSPGKTSGDADIVDARYIDIVPNDRVVQAVDFVSDAPEFAGTMTMTWTVRTTPAARWSRSSRMTCRTASRRGSRRGTRLVPRQPCGGCGVVASAQAFS